MLLFLASCSIFTILGAKENFLNFYSDISYLLISGYDQIQVHSTVVFMSEALIQFDKWSPVGCKSSAGRGKFYYYYYYYYCYKC